MLSVQNEGGQCSYLNSCDPTDTEAAKWNTATSPVGTAGGTATPPAFLTSDGTCLRQDRNAADAAAFRSAGKAFTGRNVNNPQANCAGTSKKWQAVVAANGNGANGNGAYTRNPVGQAAWLRTNQCMLDADKGQCNVVLSEFGVNLPDDVPISQLQATTGQVHAEICITDQLEQQYFRADHNQYEQMSWAFLGMQKTGLYRNWPGIYQCRTEAQCSGCSDPRFRGWYASAASGPKDVVLVLDVSGSMSASVGGGATRLTKAVEAAKWVINTLSWVDYATIVTFSSNPTVAKDASNQELIMPMTVENRQRLKDFLDGVQAFGRTDMDEGFKKAFDVLDNSRAVGKSTSCETVILFMTDGKNTGADPVPMVTSRLTDARSRIFTYNFGADATDDTMKRVACAARGIYQQVPDNGNLKKIMASYFSYLATGITPANGLTTTAQVRWAEMYEDGQGVGPNTAACAPVFDKSVSPPDLFGVICNAIKESDLLGMANWNTVWDSIQTSARSCPNLELSDAKLEQIRGTISADSQCNGLGGSGTPKDDSTGSSSGGMVGGIVGGATGGIVCLVAIFYFCCKKKRNPNVQHGAQAAARAAPAAAQAVPVAVAAPAQAHAVAVEVRRRRELQIA